MRRGGGTKENSKNPMHEAIWNHAMSSSFLTKGCAMCPPSIIEIAEAMSIECACCGWDNGNPELAFSADGEK